MFHKMMKDGNWWVWSSEQASLHCMPRYKCRNRDQLIKAYRRHGLILKA